MKIIKEITPKYLSCGVGPCPAVFVDGSNLLIIGKRLSKKDIQMLNLTERVNSDEAVIEIAKEYLFPTKEKKS